MRTDHADIMEHIAQGDLDVARAKFAERQAKGGVSGHDTQTITAALAGYVPPPDPEPQRGYPRRREVEFDQGDEGETPVVVKEA
jgi:hypothetical protein